MRRLNGRLALIGRTAATRVLAAALAFTTGLLSELVQSNEDIEISLVIATGVRLLGAVDLGRLGGRTCHQMISGIDASRASAYSRTP